MKAFVADAEWAPRSGYVPTAAELGQKRAQCGSLVWRNPHFSLREYPVPHPGDDDLLVRVKRCGICGSDSHLYETDAEGYVIFSGAVKLPCIIGHEYSGVVEGVGRNVRDFQVGDMVAAESIVWCGKCETCRSGAVNQCTHVELTGLTVDGALAEYVRVNALQCWKINSLTEQYAPDAVFDMGALIEPLGCAYNGMFVSAGGFMPGVTVVVYGVGPIGLGAVALARLAGASRIIAFDPVAARLEIAREFGADFVYNINILARQNVRPRDIVLELTGGSGAEFQVEAAGAANATIPEMESSLGAQGKIVYLGRAATYTPIMLNKLVTGANMIVGSRGHSGYAIYPNLIKLLSRGRLRVNAMITAVFSLDQVRDALVQSGHRQDGKILIRVAD
ncbi:MAG: hypothetical protein BWK76_09330 [Desulfobulbaceae bacterium A2]|nr:MAG: hypothetical protein BWK76_09330 [Desulfobulbaceae bacterium A2]